jgi:hypothetical protein
LPQAGIFLKREEAVAIINELLSSCKGMDEIYLCMIPPKGESPIAALGYQVHVRKSGNVPSETQKCISDITNRHNLEFEEIKDEEKFVIFRKH